MAWWDHEELKAPEDRSLRYKMSFPKEYGLKYIGEYMIDQYQCTYCGWQTQPYFDGSEYAISEWNKKHLKKCKKRPTHEGLWFWE